MATIKTPEQIANDQMFAFTGLDTDSRIQPGVDEDQLCQDVEQQSAEYIRDQIVEAIEADRAQRPALEQWGVFEERYPNDVQVFNCDQGTAEEIARAYNADENHCGATFVARKIGA